MRMWEELFTWTGSTHQWTDSLVTNMTFFPKATTNCLLLLRKGWGLKNTDSAPRRPGLGLGVHVSAALPCLEKAAFHSMPPCSSVRHYFGYVTLSLSVSTGTPNANMLLALYTIRTRCLQIPSPHFKSAHNLTSCYPINNSCSVIDWWDVQSDALTHNAQHGME